MSKIKIQTSGDLLRRIDGLISSLTDECKLHIHETDGLSVRVVDPANVGMVGFEVPPSGFEAFDLDGSITVGLPRLRLSSIARYARKGTTAKDDHGDDVTLVFDDETHRFYVHVERDDVGRYSSFAEIDPDAIREEPDLPAIDLPWETSLDAKTFRDMMETLHKDEYSHVQLAAEGLSNGVSGDETAGVRFYGSDEKREDVFRPDATATWTGRGDAEASKSLYSLDYLIKIAKGLHSAKPDAVKVEFGDEFPARINFSESEFGLSGTYMLAPRIKKDGDGGPAYSNPSFDADLFENGDEDEAGEEEEEVEA
jgi:proliferating cell nuclear antigen